MNFEVASTVQKNEASASSVIRCGIGLFLDNNNNFFMRFFINLKCKKFYSLLHKREKERQGGGSVVE